MLPSSRSAAPHSIPVITTLLVPFSTVKLTEFAEFIFRTTVGSDQSQLLFERDMQGDVGGLLRFAHHDELPFNVDLFLIVFSTQRIDSIDEMLEDSVKAWDALSIKGICRQTEQPRRQANKQCPEEADITDALVERTQRMKL